MNNKEQIKEILGEYYIDTLTTRVKQVYIDCINKFINQDASFLPTFMDKEQMLKYYSKSSINSVENMSKRLETNLVILNINMFTFDMCHEVKSQLYGRNDCFVVYDAKDKIKKILVRRGTGYGSTFKELSKNLSINTLINFYKIFVYNVLSHKLNIKRKKDIFQKYVNLISSNTIYFNRDNISFKKYEVGSKYSLFDSTMSLKVISIYSTKLQKHQSSVSYQNFNDIEQFFNMIKNCQKINSVEEIEFIIKECIDKEIEEKIKEKDEILSKIESYNIF